MRILIFNPENDLALASNDPHYTPPASARQMAADLQDLPRLWAGERDVIIARQRTAHPQPLPREGSVGKMTDCLVSPPLGGGGGGLSLLPWGWSPLLVRQLREHGIAETLLPTKEQLAAYRAFSSRETAVRLLQRLRKEWPEPFGSGTLVGESKWCISENQVLCAIAEYGETAMLKAPWSGSGRGVHPVNELPLPKQTLSWVRRTLQTQGGVEVEPLYHKIQDLAMEFWAENGQVRYEGLSLFETTAGGVYAGNLVATEQEKEARLAAYLSPTLLHEVRTHLISLLNEAALPSWYTGPLGIDMMIVKPQLHPFVELNLRMTMGWVALKLTSRLRDRETGVFCITQQREHYQALLNEQLVIINQQTDDVSHISGCAAKTP